MKIDKSQIIDLLNQRGERVQASQAESELPDQVDTDQDASTLSRYGIDPSDLAGGAGSKLGL